MDVNDTSYHLQDEIDKMEDEGYEIISHSRVRGKIWDEDIILAKKQEITSLKAIYNQAIDDAISMINCDDYKVIESRIKSLKK